MCSRGVVENAFDGLLKNRQPGNSDAADDHLVDGSFTTRG